MTTRAALTGFLLASLSAAAVAQAPGMPMKSDRTSEKNSLSVVPGVVTNERRQETKLLATSQAEAPATIRATPVQVAVPAAATQPAAGALPVADQIANIDAQLVDLARLQHATERTRAQLELLTANEAINEITRRTAGTQTGLSEVPLLVGIMTTNATMLAEFLANGAIMQVSEGEMVSPEWQLVKIKRNSVEIKRRGRNERHVVMFGGSAKTP